MKHARDDYNRIQDPQGLIPDDEPVFLLRAQDKTAPATVEAWCAANIKEGGDGELINLAFEQVDRMRAWQKTHGSKLPDLTR